jgi:hypothetical protein
VDKLVVITDSYHAKVPRNPVTGRSWKPGDLDEVVAEHRGRERGWVTDSLIVIEQERFGSFKLLNQPYDPGPPLHWGTRQLMDSKSAPIGGPLTQMFDKGDDVDVEIPAAMPMAAREELLRFGLQSIGCVFE